MKENFYHNLAKTPALKAKNMPAHLEELAAALVASGRFRVDTVVEQNFVRWNRPYENVNMIFSHREIFDETLLFRTKNIMEKVLGKKYSGKTLQNKIKAELDRLYIEAKKNIDVDKEVELMLARIIVQSAEPPVILLILAEGTEVFVSYSYTVGDMLDIQTWQEAGDSSGLQATEREGCKVFVSAGGNPLVTKPNPDRPGDGFLALSRMIVIAGQELAHYSDIIRSGRKKGSRYSADLWYGRASQVASVGRIKDQQTVAYWHHQISRIGLKFVAEAERSLKFYREHRKWSLIVLRTKIKVWILQAIFIILCKITGLNFLKIFYKDEYMCQKITTMLADMLFNLEPEADAYRRPNKIEEEMIMCIEALARVQQQANKWGRPITEIMYPNLSELYYDKVLPGCIEAWEKMMQQKFPEIYLPSSLKSKRQNELVQRLRLDIKKV